MRITLAVASALYLATTVVSLPVDGTPVVEVKDGHVVDTFAPIDWINGKAVAHKPPPDDGFRLDWRKIYEARWTDECKDQSGALHPTQNELKFTDKTAKTIKHMACTLPNGKDITANVYTELLNSGFLEKSQRVLRT